MFPAALLFLAAALAASDTVHRYDVHVDEGLQRFDVRACFADGLPERLVANHPLAARITGGFRYLRDGTKVERTARSNVIHLPHPSDDGCIEWQANIDLVAETGKWNIGMRAGDARVLALDTWFWRPPVLTTNREMEVRFHLPPGVRVSMPWEPLNDEGTLFRRDHSPLDWPAMMAIGELEQRVFKVKGSEFRLSLAPGPGQALLNETEQWLRPAARAVSELWGKFPVDGVQLLVVPVSRGYDAAPWAQTNRGGGAGVHLFMNTRAKRQVFLEDWIATHELAHFVLPYVRRHDAWLPEGFASYYQNVLRARAGMITPAEAWQAMYEGFLRGNRNAGYDTLRDDTRYMVSRGRAMRVYWSGAAIALKADLALRNLPNGDWSLDRVLREFNACCRKPERTWSGRELFEAFDRLVGESVFIPLYESHVYSRHFPRLDEAWQMLGIEVAGDEVKLNIGQGETLRDAIMHPVNAD